MHRKIFKIFLHQLANKNPKLQSFKDFTATRRTPEPPPREIRSGKRHPKDQTVERPKNRISPNRQGLCAARRLHQPPRHVRLPVAHKLG